MDWEKGWIQERDSERIDSVFKQLSTGIFEMTSTGGQNQHNDKRMHIYVTNISDFLKMVLLLHYLLLVLFGIWNIGDSSVVLQLERIGLIMIMMASLSLTGYQFGDYTADPELPDWRKDGNTMASIHTGCLLLLLGTFYLLMVTFLQDPTLDIEPVLVVIALIVAPLLVMGISYQTLDHVELPPINEGDTSNRSLMWKYRL